MISFNMYLSSHVKSFRGHDEMFLVQHNVIHVSVAYGRSVHVDSVLYYGLLNQ